MFKKYSDFVVDKPKVDSQPLQEGWVSDFVKKRVGVFSNEYITEDDAELLKYAFLNIYVDALSGVVYSDSMTGMAKSLVLKPENLMSIIQKDLKYLIKAQKGHKHEKDTIYSTKKGKKRAEKEHGIDIVYTGRHLNGTNLLDVLEKAVKNIYHYINNNIDAYIDKYFSTNVLAKAQYRNNVVADQYKKLFDFVIKPIEGQKQSQLEMLGRIVVKKIKKDMGIDLENMVIDESKQKENKYLKSKALREEIVDKDPVSKPEEKEIHKEIEETVVEEPIKEIPTIEEPIKKPEVFSKPEISQIFIDNIIDRYCDFNGIIKNKTLSAGLSKEVKKIYDTFEGTPTENDIFQILNKGNVRKERIEPTEPKVEEPVVQEPGHIVSEPIKEEPIIKQQIDPIPTEEFVNKVLEEYIKMTGFPRTRRLEMGISGDIKKAYSKKAEEGIEPTQSDILKEIMSA